MKDFGRWLADRKPVEAKPKRRVLTEAAQADRDHFDFDYKDYGCTCFIMPPCGWCTHPGNPHNQDEDDDCWQEE